MVSRLIMIAAGVKPKMSITSPQPFVVLLEVLPFVDVSKIGAQFVTAAPDYQVKDISAC